MHPTIDTRTLELAKYIIQHNSTVRDTARAFGISKSTVHKDVSVRLYELDKLLCQRVRRILDKNKRERHLRGGAATKAKYSHMSQHTGSKEKTAG